jgi:hypothetical protein
MLRLRPTPNLGVESQVRFMPLMAELRRWPVECQKEDSDVD